MTARSDAPNRGGRDAGASKPSPAAPPGSDLDERLDEADAESLPAGDPPAVTPPHDPQRRDQR